MHRSWLHKKERNKILESNQSPSFLGTTPDVVFNPRDTATLVATAHGDSSPSYQWLFSGSEIPFATQPTLTIPSMTETRHFL